MNCQQKSREHAENNRNDTNFFDYFSSLEANLVHQCGYRFCFPPFIGPASVTVTMFSSFFLTPAWFLMLAILLFIVYFHYLILAGSVGFLAPVSAKKVICNKFCHPLIPRNLLPDFF